MYIFASNLDCEGNCAEGETQINLDYISEGESNFSVYIVEGEELFAATVDGSASLVSCFDKTRKSVYSCRNQRRFELEFIMVWNRET